MINAFMTTLKWFLLMSGTLIWLAIIIVYMQPTVVIYDCTIAEISPDFPIDVRNECRKLRNVKRFST